MRTALVIVGSFALLLLICWGATYNSLVSGQEDCKEKGGQVQSSYQRRFDLIPNLVETVKASAAFEKSTQVEVAEARSKVGSLKIDKSAFTTDLEAQGQFIKAQEQLGSALQHLIVSVERYPDLKSNANFLDLQSQLEGTENRINVARRDYQISVAAYNKTVRGFLSGFVANCHGFRQLPYYEADEAAQKAPVVKF